MILKDIRPCYLVIPVFLFLSVFNISSEEVKSYLIKIPEFTDMSGGSYSHPDSRMLMKSLQQEIYEVFSHYSSGNAEKSESGRNTDDALFHIVNPLVFLNFVTASEKGGFFCETELNLPGEDDSRISMKYTGYGTSTDEAFLSSLSKLPSLLRHRYSDFDEKGGFFRILDIYQKEVIVSCGKSDGFSKGDYLEILDSITGRPEGRIILTDSDSEISYGRLLEWEPRGKRNGQEGKSEAELPGLERPDLPEAGTRVRKIEYLGLDTSVSWNYLVDDLFSGYGFNFKLEYFRSFYIFHPFFSVGIYNLETELNNYDLSVFSAGLAMFRHFGKVSVYSEISLGKGWYRKSLSSSSDFNGGCVKAGAEYYLARHLGLFTEAGFMKLFAESAEDPDVGGFLFGAGLSFKY